MISACSCTDANLANAYKSYFPTIWKIWKNKRQKEMEKWDRADQPRRKSLYNCQANNAKQQGRQPEEKPLQCASNSEPPLNHPVSTVRHLTLSHKLIACRFEAYAEKFD